MNTPTRSNRSVTRVCYKESSIDGKYFDNGKHSLRSRRRLSRSCSPQADVDTKENSVRKYDSVDALKSPTRSKMIESSVVLTDLKNLNPEILLGSPARKSKRPKKKTELIIEYEKTRVTRRASINVNYKEPDLSDFDCSIAEDRNKPNALFSDDDIEGKHIFGFQSPRKNKIPLRNSKMAMDCDEDSITPRVSPTSAKSSFQTTRSHRGRDKPQPRCGSPAQSKTSTPIMASSNQQSMTPTRRNLLSGFGGKNTLDIAATPKAIRNKIKKEIAKQIDSNSDYSYESSEVSEADISSESSTEESSSSSDNDTTIPTKKRLNTANIAKNEMKTPQRKLRMRQKKDADSEYILKSDNYFSMHGSKKIVTSNHTMERLKNPQLTEDHLQDMMENVSISEEHIEAIDDLNTDYSNSFDKWIYYMSEGYNILAYGLGSKRDVLRDFVQYAFLTVDIPCFVVNGYFPGLTIKDVLRSITVDLLRMPSSPSNVFEAVNAIDEHLTAHNTQFALAVHNIDGPTLRNEKAQYLLSKLASLKNVYFVASMDHIRAPLFWGSSKLRSFNFSWWDVTTLKPYTEETVNENLSLVRKAGALALSSLKNVFLSLNAKARGIFFIIAKKQINGTKTSHYQGLPYQELYSLAREAFLVSSDFALRTQLTEFIDHKLIKMKRSVDGAEHLQIPIDNNLLQVFMEQQEES